jgi:hypothetical protein
LAPAGSKGGTAYATKARLRTVAIVNDLIFAVYVDLERKLD